MMIALNEPDEVQVAETHAPPTKMLRTLMDIARTENSWPSYKNTDQIAYLSTYMERYSKEPAEP